jgi:hypothetical protein
MWSLHMPMHTGNGSIPGRIAKSNFLCFTHRSRRKSGFLDVPADGRPSGRVPGVTNITGVASVAGSLIRPAAVQPEPEREKDQKEKDAAADSTADDRPRRVRASVRST